MDKQEITELQEAVKEAAYLTKIKARLARGRGLRESIPVDMAEYLRFLQDTKTIAEQQHARLRTVFLCLEARCAARFGYKAPERMLLRFYNSLIRFCTRYNLVDRRKPEERLRQDTVSADLVSQALALRYPDRTHNQSRIQFMADMIRYYERRVKAQEAIKESVK